MLTIYGATDAVSVVIRMAMVQTRTPHDMLGRVMAVNSMCTGTSGTLGEFRAGLVAAAFGAVTSVLVGGLGALLVVAAVDAPLPRSRAHQERGARGPVSPQQRASAHARSSSASSPPGQAMNDSPAGQPATVPIGMLICGRPASPAMQVSRMTRTRNDSSSSPVMSMRGAMQGAVGSATTVPGGTRPRRWARAGADDPARRVGLRGRHGRGERHALLDAGSERRLGARDEIAEGRPGLARLHDAERLAPAVEAVGRDAVCACGRRQRARGARQEVAPERRDRRVGLREGVVRDDQMCRSAPPPSRRRAAPRRRGA